MRQGTRFLLGFGGAIVGLIVLLALVFTGLDQVDRLKAPAFANRLSFDEKLRYLRQHDLEDPEVLFIGSSTTLHGLDGALIQDILDVQGEVANLGVQDLRIDQTRFVADFFLDLFDPERVVMVSTMLDFKDCSDGDSAFFKPDHVRDYLEGGSELFYHYKYFDPKGVFEHARNIQFLRETDDRLEAASFDEYGSMLLDVPPENVNPRVMRGDPITLDPACYEQLEALARELEQQGVAFTYVIAPMRPSYLEDRDPGGRLLAEHREELRNHLGQTGTTVVDAHAALDMPETAFFDAYHLNSEEARTLTRFIGERILAENQEREPDHAREPAAASLPAQRAKPAQGG